MDCVIVLYDWKLIIYSLVPTRLHVLCPLCYCCYTRNKETAFTYIYSVARREFDENINSTLISYICYTNKVYHCCYYYIINLTYLSLYTHTPHTQNWAELVVSTGTSGRAGKVCSPSSFQPEAPVMRQKEEVGNQTLCVMCVMCVMCVIHVSCLGLTASLPCVKSFPVVVWCAAGLFLYRPSSVLYRNVFLSLASEVRLGSFCICAVDMFRVGLFHFFFFFDCRWGCRPGVCVLCQPAVLFGISVFCRVSTYCGASINRWSEVWTDWTETSQTQKTLTHDHWWKYQNHYRYCILHYK